MTTVRTVVVPVLAVIVFTLLAAALPASPAGALAIDERQGDQYGWAVD